MLCPIALKVNEKNQVNMLENSGKWNQRKSNGYKSTENLKSEGRQMKLR